MRKFRPRRGLFLVLEGPDKSGKSTQAAFLASRLRGLGRGVLHTREPGGGPFAEGVRKLLLDAKLSVHPLAELLLYEASRAQHVHETLNPALRSGAVVICERFTMATLAYQGFARGLPMALVRRLNRVASSGLAPDMTLILDLPEREFHRRDLRREHDRMEREGAAFRRKVRGAYRRLARSEPRCVLIDASRSPESVREEIAARVERLLASRVRSPA